MDIVTNIFDQEEVHEKCRVTIWRNSQTGERSIGWEEDPELVRVVRCKDCKFNIEDYNNYPYSVCSFHMRALGHDDFCSFGAREDSA